MAAGGKGGGGAVAPRRGRVAPHIAEELPGLGISWIEVAARPGRSPEPVRLRLRHLSDRFYGAHAIHLRERPIPWAYRVFYRQIGLDPDRIPPAPERLAMERLREGSFASRGLPEDALRIATAETGVALRAFDAGRLRGSLCIRDVAPGERLRGSTTVLARGALTIADEEGPLTLLFGEEAECCEAGPDTERLAVVAVQVKGVADAAIEEALWTVATTLSG